MRAYMNSGGNSNVEAYEIGADYIDVKFYGTSKVYRYSYQSAGQENIDQMKSLALRGSGLNSFIMRNVKYKYER